MTPAPVKPPIPLSVVEQIDVRVGTIRSVEEVVGSDKLRCLRVDFGDHERDILAGIRLERDDPHQLEGRQALFVINLQPRKMFGVLSQGMLFDIGFSDGLRPVLAIPETPVPDGSRAS